ncbi:amino acid adenylation domain-containing protein [Nocardia sp.]|uniref:amino acid adenylation domain-containing protein n=1 Tax=Nocardia sp. TaxID=1821 RepID=UPI00260A3BD8|nr:amino acid adenylation domain-containing protein [Nocardia sp.]
MIVRFESQVVRTPQATAVVCGPVSLTFARLDALAGWLARALVDSGMGPERRVAVALPRSEWSVVAALAVWKAGAVYVPVDPNYPAERIAFMLRDASPGVVLTSAHPTAAVVKSGRRLMSVSDVADGPDRQLTGTRLREPDEWDGRNAAYVIYTSGSTGTPKGVTVERRALANLARHLSPSSPTFTAALRPFGERPLRLSQSASWSFDASLAPLLWMLHGNELHVLEDAIRMNPETLVRYLRQHAIDHLDITPTQARRLLRHGLAAVCAERPLLLLVGGEPVTEQLWRELAALPNVAAFHGYGPTEFTVDATVTPLTGDVITIGRPIPGTGARMLDERLRPLPSRVPGELYLSGRSLARGYLGRPGVTAARFIADPLGPPGGRMYRTGDLVGETGEGDLFFAGRADEQVKIRGFRVEPGEVEAALEDLPGLGEVAVVAVPADDGGLRLVCYATPASAIETIAPSPERLRAHLAARLPRYMVPELYILRDDLPRTANDKLDRVALRAPTSLPGPEPDASGAGTTNENTVAADQNVRETTIRTLFAQVLGLAEVAATDRFFELGGDSIVAMQLAAQAQAAGLAIVPEEILQHQTPAELAAVAVPTRPGAGPAGAPGDDEDGSLPATPIICWLREMGEHVSSYRQSVAFRTPAGPLRPDVPALVDGLLRRHAALRMRLERGTCGDLWTVPVTAFVANEVLTTVDIAGLDTVPVAALLAEHEARNGDLLDPWTGRMLRATSFDAGADKPGLLLLTIHHLAVDGVSWRIIQRELRNSSVPDSTLSPMSGAAQAMSFRRWARFLAEDAVSADRVSELDLWVRTLDGSDPPLSARKLDPAMDTVATARTLTVSLPIETTAALLTGVPKTLRLQVNELLLAGLGVAVAYWRRRLGVAGDVVLVDMEGHGREPLAVGLDPSGTVGWFTSIFPVRLDTGPIDWDDLAIGGSGWRPVLRRCKAWLRAIPNRGVGYGLLRYLNPDTAPVLTDRTPPQICFNYLGRMGTDADIDWNPIAEPSTGFGLLLDGADGEMPLAHTITVDALTRDERDGPRLEATVTWAANLLAEADIQALAETWLQALSAIVRYARTPRAGGLVPADVPLVTLSQAEIDLVQAAWESR